MSATSGSGSAGAPVDQVPPVKPDSPRPGSRSATTSGSPRSGSTRSPRTRGSVLIPAHDETASGQQEVYFVHAGEVAATLDGERVLVAAGGVIAVEPRSPARSRPPPARRRCSASGARRGRPTRSAPGSAEPASQANGSAATVAGTPPASTWSPSATSCRITARPIGPSRGLETADPSGRPCDRPRSPAIRQAAGRHRSADRAAGGWGGPGNAAGRPAPGRDSNPSCS